MGNSLLSVSDVFGFGRAAESKAAAKLVDAISKGVGNFLEPFHAKRRGRAAIEIRKEYEKEFGLSGDSELVIGKRADLRLRSQAIGFQENREKIAAQAIEDFKNNPDANIGDAEFIDDDWLNYFWQKAETVSNDEMQEVWARVLNRKVSGKSLGLRTLDTLRTMSRDEALIIERLAAFKVAFGPDHPNWRHSIGILTYLDVQLAGDQTEAPESITVQGGRVFDPKKNTYQKEISDLIGNTFSHVLGPMGIYVESGFSHTFALNWSKEALPVQIGNSDFFIEGLPRGGADDGYGLTRFGSGIGFSQIGWEIFSLANVTANTQYIELLRQALALRNLELVAR